MYPPRSLNYRESCRKTADNVPVAVGYSGSIDDDVAITTIRLLKGRFPAIYLEPQQTAALLGGAELTQQFEEKTLEKPLHFTHAFCFGVQLPDGDAMNLSLRHGYLPIPEKKPFTSLIMGISLMSISFAVYL